SLVISLGRGVSTAMSSRKFLFYSVRMGKRLPDIKYCEVPSALSGVPRLEVPRRTEQGSGRGTFDRESPHPGNCAPIEEATKMLVGRVVLKPMGFPRPGHPGRGLGSP